MITVIVIHYRLFFIWFTSGKSLLLVTGSTQDKLLMIFHTFKTIEISEKSLTQSYWVENSCYRRLVIARGNQVLRSLNLNLAIWINLQWYANMVLYWQTTAKVFMCQSLVYHCMRPMLNWNFISHLIGGQNFWLKNPHPVYLIYWPHLVIIVNFWCPII